MQGRCDNGRSICPRWFLHSRFLPTVDDSSCLQWKLGRSSKERSITGASHLEAHRAAAVAASLGVCTAIVEDTLKLLIERIEVLVRMLAEGDNGWNRPDRAFAPRTYDELQRLLHELKKYTWRPITTAPRNGTFILVRGDSGYTTTPYRMAVCQWSRDYGGWMTHSHDRFTDGGDDATEWMPVP
jgi:hypothetical protein